MWEGDGEKMKRGGVEWESRDWTTYGRHTLPQNPPSW